MYPSRLLTVRHFELHVEHPNYGITNILYRTYKMYMYIKILICIVFLITNYKNYCKCVVLTVRVVKHVESFGSSGLIMSYVVFVIFLKLQSKVTM